MEARNFVNKMKNDKKFCDAVINNRNIATTEFARMATLGLSCAPGPQRDLLILLRWQAVVHHRG